MLSNNKGFSLIELMVVVAIIAILSTIAIPSYQTFQAKARQKEGFALLGSYFGAAQASRAELGFFPGNFVETGFAPVGTLNYTLLAANMAGHVMPYGQITTAAMVACVDTRTPAACPAGPPAYAEWVTGPVGVVATSLGTAAPATAPTASATQFLVAAASVVSLKAVAIDEYSMNETKSLLMVSDGLK